MLYSLALFFFLRKTFLISPTGLRSNLYVLYGRPVAKGLLNSILFPCCTQLSFEMWTNQMQETLNSKKKGDVAFRHKEFSAAIDYYTQV